MQNLGFPGQYYDQETGHNYNYYRDYDPGTGRFTESDPNGLLAGVNTYNYAATSPLGNIDPTGLATVTGSWITPPQINVTNFGASNISLVAPTWSWWGYLDILQATVHANGYINIDVKCHSSDCQSNDWEIHNRISFGVSGNVQFGPNLYASVVSARLGPKGWALANLLIIEAHLLYEEHSVLNALAQKQAGPILQSVLAGGPTAICLGSAL